MTQDDIKHTLEAALITCESALSLSQMIALFVDDESVSAVDTVDIQSALEALQQDYTGRGIELKKVASGYRIQVKPHITPRILSLWDEKPQRYSRALLETLSLIAYRQPITRGDIEDVRGVSVSTQIIKTLLERDWVKIVGHRDVPGKPAMYATTEAFLDYFNLESLENLPPLSEIREIDDQNRRLQFGDEEEKPEQTTLEEAFDKDTVKAREDEVLEQTEQDMATAASLVAQVEANVFKKEEEQEATSNASDVASLVEQFASTDESENKTQTDGDTT